MKKMMRGIAATAVAIGLATAPALGAEAASGLPKPNKKPPSGAKLIAVQTCTFKKNDSGVAAFKYLYPAPVKHRNQVQIYAQDRPNLMLWSVTVDGKAANIKWTRTPTTRWPGDKRKSVNEGFNIVAGPASREVKVVTVWKEVRLLRLVTSTCSMTL